MIFFVIFIVCNCIATPDFVFFLCSKWLLLVDYSCHGFFCFDHSYIMLLVTGCCEKWAHTHSQFMSVNVANHPHILVLPRREQPEDKQQLLSHHLPLSYTHHTLCLFLSPYRSLIASLKSSLLPALLSPFSLLPCPTSPQSTLSLSVIAALIFTGPLPCHISISLNSHTFLVSTPCRFVFILTQTHTTSCTHTVWYPGHITMPCIHFL